MIWEVEQVRRCAMATFAVGIVGTAMLCLSFATTNWMVLPPEHYYIKTHTLYMGLWADRACGPSECGQVPTTDFRELTSTGWNLVLGLLCTTISLVFVGASLNIVILVSPIKTFTVLSGVFWLLAAVANMISVIMFWNKFSVYQQFHSWSLWVSCVSTIIFYAVGLTLSIFACCHRWVTRMARDGPEDPVAVAPPPVVSYRSEATTSDGKPYDFSADPDMQPYTFGGKAYDSNRSNNGHAQSYHI